MGSLAVVYASLFSSAETVEGNEHENQEKESYTRIFDDNLVQIGDSKFYYSLFPRKYDECKAVAAAYDFSLASIHSDEQNELIFNELGDYSTWIGGYQTGPNSF